MIVLIFLLGVLLGLAGGYTGLVVHYRWHEDNPGVHRMHNEGPRLLMGDGALL